MWRPSRVLTLGNLEAHLDVVTGILAFGLDALNDITELVLVPLHLLREVGDDGDIAVLEAGEPEVLVVVCARCASAVGVLIRQGAVEPRYRELRLAQGVLRFLLEAAEFDGRQGDDFAHGELIASFDGRPVTYGFGELDTLVPAYAATIHKSQGSEYPAVVIPVMTQHYTMLQRNLIYTGITRGKKLVVIVGQAKAVAIAVKNVSGRRRWTKLKEWLGSTPKPAIRR